MRAIAVTPGQPNSVHLAELEKPSIADVAAGRGVLVEVLRVGVDGTDKEINAALYGAAPPGYDFLVVGHESFGRVVAVGPNVRGLRPGDFVSATVRRPGKSLYDRIGHYDMTTDEIYYERGINLLHGFLTEYFVEDPEYLVKVPPQLKHVGVLMEPMSVVEKGVRQTFEIQRRLRLWHPQRAAVMGSGALGLLATLAFRLRGLEVVMFSRSEPPTLKSGLAEAIGGRYVSTRQTSLKDASEKHGPFDIIFEATGSSRVAFESMEILNKNGVLILTSITSEHRSLEVPADDINLDFVLGNKLMFGTVNANREYFEEGVRDFAHAEAQYPGWLEQLLTHPVDGLENYAELMRQLTEDKGAVKVFLNVRPLD